MRSLACTRWVAHSVFLIFLGIVASQAQLDPSHVAGYLSRVPAANLRFAPPPKPPVAQLALSGIRADPSPYLNNKFLTDKAVLTNRPIDLHFLEPQTLRKADAMSSKPLANAVVAPDMEVLSPQALVRFFEVKANVAPGNLKAAPAFQIPVKKPAEAVLTTSRHTD